MIKILLLFYISILYIFPNKFEIKIDKNTTKDQISEYVTIAKERGIEMKILYVSYFDTGKVRTLQVRFSSEVGSNLATLNFIENDNCVYFFRDYDPKAKVKMGIGSCPAVDSL
ncbi:hypothetical protein [Algoriphagus aquimarinus]|uniref:Uncharacterized protein n=1 Tax=Algoriphagus aquimarinus TaxID=237018 RepID=A0A1I0VAS9_9BACT|nr:hypothetical protein [Algoriphagus aquimarinus]SFA73120.1 hypothetical protein SAMN04489723_10188 [Algoriphagus aquimarinus]|tara:strand:- start:64927 stop:65265 length:339 start_codon:yes stop_codon:yes gene_type:complete